MKQVRRYTDYGKIVLAWVVAFLLAAGVYYLIRTWNPFAQIILTALVFCGADGGILMLTKESFLTAMVKRKR